MPQLWVGNQMISPAKNTTSFDVGNFLRSYKPDEVHDSQTPSLILRLDGRHSHPVVYEICKIVCRPVILRNPLSFADGVLRWNIEGNFIGKSTSKFRLDLEIGEETYSCELPNEDKELNGVIDLPDGIYPYRLLLVEHSLFACAKSTQLYVDSIIVGDPNSFKFKNTYIFLKAASCWDLKNDTYLQLSLRPEHTRICDIEYTGMSMPTWGEDGLCPSYRGTLQFWNAKWNSWTNFNFDANRERFEHINPIQFWIISDHFLAIYAANEGPLYVDKRYGSILNKAYECLTKTEQLQIEIPDKFEFETRKIK
jgi:hypothetical protein